MKLLLDTNILLDIALKREPFFSDSANVFRIIDNKFIFGFITATTVTDLYYIARKERGHLSSLEFIDNLLQIIDIVGIDKEIIMDAIKLNVSDFEDSIKSVAAIYSGIDIIITRNTKDFKHSEIKALTPTEYLAFFAKKE